MWLQVNVMPGSPEQKLHLSKTDHKKMFAEKLLKEIYYR